MSEKVLNKFYFYATTLLTYSGCDPLPFYAKPIYKFQFTHP